MENVASENLVSTSGPAPRERVRSRITLTLAAEDPKYHFHGFSPYLLSLGGESGVPVTGAPEKAKFNDKPLQWEDALSGTAGALQLTFHAQREVEDVVALTDLYLWYRHARLFKIDFKQAKVEPAAK